MAPIHDAADGGDLATMNRLLVEDGGRLNALDPDGWTPLMCATFNEHDAVVARLLALGANKMVQEHEHGYTATHIACEHNRASCLALLLDAGAPLNALTKKKNTPLNVAAFYGAADCVAQLITRGGATLDLNAKDTYESTALRFAAWKNYPEIVGLLLRAGADPTIASNDGITALDDARSQGNQACIALLEAAMAEPQRLRLLFKARTLLDTALAVRKAADDAQAKGMSRAVQQRAALAAAPAYLEERVAWGEELPSVRNDDAEQDEELVGCVKYALGLEGGGGVTLVEGQAPQVGMLKEVFVELLEMIVPKWARGEM